MEKSLDLRIQKTYLALHNAFTTLLAERHFEDFTVGELCDRAMIRRTTFYKHFADKQEYFSFYFREICAEFEEYVFPKATSNNFEEYTYLMTEKLLAFIHQNELMIRNLMESNMFALLLNLLMDIITTEIQRILTSSNQFDDLTRKQLEGTAAFYSGGLLNTLYRMLKQDTPFDDKEFTDIILFYSSLFVPQKNNATVPGPV